MEKESRGKLLTIRVSSSELARWQARAAGSGLVLSDFVRQLLDSHQPKRRRAATADPALLATLGRLNSNINQLARWANTHKSKAEAVPLLAALAAIDKHLFSILPNSNRGEADAD